MRVNYLLHDIRLQHSKDIELLRSLTLSSMYKDEVVVNLYVDNEHILKESISMIGECRFGILRRLPLINVYFNLNNVSSVKDLSNDIQNFITPIVKFDLAVNNIMERVKSILCLFKQKGWKLQIILDVNNTEEFTQSIDFCNWIKCEFFEDDICVLFNFGNDKALLESAYKNMTYVIDTIKFLGMRNNIIVDCLLKAVREKETGIYQDFDSSYFNVIKELMLFDTEKYYGKKTLIRETMDDFAMV